MERNGKRYVIYYDGSENEIRNGHLAGKHYNFEVNGTRYSVPFDQNGFPDFSQWTDYETRLSVDQYLLGDQAQFRLLNKRLARDMENNEALRNRINDGLMEVLREGIGEKNGNGRIKLKKLMVELS